MSAQNVPPLRPLSRRVLDRDDPLAAARERTRIAALEEAERARVAAEVEAEPERVRINADSCALLFHPHFPEPACYCVIQEMLVGKDFGNLETAANKQEHLYRLKLIIRKGLSWKKFMYLPRWNRSIINWMKQREVEMPDEVDWDLVYPYPTRRSLYPPGSRKKKRDYSRDKLSAPVLAFDEGRPSTQNLTLLEQFMCSGMEKSVETMAKAGFLVVPTNDMVVKIKAKADAQGVHYTDEIYTIRREQVTLIKKSFLLWAIEKMNLGLVTWLREEKGEDISGYKMLIAALNGFYKSEEKALPLAKYIVEKGETSKKDINAATFNVIDQGFVPALRFLIEEAGADPRQVSIDEGETLLFFASYFADELSIGTFRYLLEECKLDILAVDTGTNTTALYNLTHCERYWDFFDRQTDAQRAAIVELKTYLQERVRAAGGTVPPPTPDYNDY